MHFNSDQPPPEVAVTRVNPINFTIYSPREPQHKPGWKKDSKFAKKY